METLQISALEGLIQRKKKKKRSQTVRGTFFQCWQTYAAKKNHGKTKIHAGPVMSNVKEETCSSVGNKCEECSNFQLTDGHSLSGFLHRMSQQWEDTFRLRGGHRKRMCQRTQTDVRLDYFLLNKAFVVILFFFFASE